MSSTVISQQKEKIEKDSEKLLKFIQENSHCDKKLISEHLGFNKEKIRVVAIKLKEEGKIVIETIGKSRNQLYRAIQTNVKKENYTIQHSKNFDKYLFNGNTLSKGATVLAIVKQYVQDNADLNIKQLKEIFHDDLLRNKNYGVIQPLRYAEEKPKRYFLKENQLIRLLDSSIIAVCNQISATNILPFIELSRKLGYIVEKA